MIDDAKNTMMTGAPKEKSGTLFHFSGDGVYFPKAIIAGSIEEAELVWHKVKVFIHPQQTTGPAAQSPIPPVPPEKPKVEDKPIENENE